jgi:adenylosuccinate lyase
LCFRARPQPRFFETVPASETIPNVLAERYASAAMRSIWSARGRVGLERDLWIAVLEAQRDLGLKIPASAIEDYAKARGTIDLASIEARERLLLHDVKARLEEFNALAGHEIIHLGMTSRDLTENVEQLQVARAMEVARLKAVAALDRLARRAREHRTLLITGRTHNVPAQPTTFGKRLAMFGEELGLALERLDGLIARYPVRGLKGAVGTQLDQTTLFEGSAAKVAKLEARLVKHLGFGRAFGAAGQVYPRSLDFEVVSALHQLAAAAGSFATTVRLMAGFGLMTEGFKKGQVGSSAMPHKVNCRNCERIHGLSTVLAGHVAMAARLAGEQWNEGDVSCSAVRRVVLPDAFFAVDGLFETFLTVLDQFEVFPAAIRAENERHLPFLASTTILMEAVKRGAGRETAHAAIKEHALAAAKELREGSGDAGLVGRLAGDARLGLTRAQILAVLRDGKRFFGAAPAQVDAFVRGVRRWTRRFPAARTLQPAPLL